MKTGDPSSIPIEWMNREKDARSNLLRFLIAILTVCVLEFIISIYFLIKDDFATNFTIGQSLIIIFVGAVTYYLTFTIALPLAARAVTYMVVPAGHQGIVFFGMERTGELAGSGKFYGPIGYNLQVVDCTPRIYEIGPCDVQSADGFKLRAEVKSNVRIVNPLKYQEIADPQLLIKTSLTAALNSAVNGTEAIRVVATRKEVETQAEAALNARLRVYGLSIDYVDIIVSETPSHLSEIVGFVSMLSKSIPGVPNQEILEFVLTYLGKIRRADSNSSIRVNAAGIDDLIRAASNHFGRRN